MSRAIQPTETRTLQFGLTYASPPAGLAAPAFTLHTGDGDYPLVPHTEATRAEHRKSNRALALLSDGQLRQITHFAADVVLPADVARWLRVTFPLPGSPLPSLAALITWVPAAARAANRRHDPARLRLRQHPVLAALGVQAPQDAPGGPAPGDEELLALWADADLIHEAPIDVARSLAFSHPQLATRDPGTAAVVLDDHISQAKDLRAFATVISGLGTPTERGGWAIIRPSVDQHGKELRWGPGYEDQGHPEGTTVYVYDLNRKIAGTVDAPPGDTTGLSVVNQSLRTSQADVRLENQSWAVLQGTPDVRQSSGLTAELAAAARAREFNFTLNNRTPGYGLEVPKSSIRFAADQADPRRGEFGVDARNTFLRTLAAYVEFLDSQGRPIDDPPGWTDRLPTFPPFDKLQTRSKKYISSVGAVSTILGIPVPTDPELLDFPFPAEAASLRLSFGGIGTRNWDPVVDPVGILLTGIFQYGIPTLFLLGGAAITSSAFYKTFVADTENVIIALAVAFPIVGGGVATAAALGNTKSVLFAFSDAIAGIIVEKGLEKLAAYIATRLTLAQIANAVPIVGFAFRIAQTAITFASLATTTIEVLISPATYQIDVRRQLNLELTVGPDPLHGIWPQVATRYVATVQYRNGTNFCVDGDLPANRAEPVVVNFPELPGGGQFQPAFGVYTPERWLAGSWTGSWVDAVAPAGSGGALTLAGQIQERVVPLSADTQYLYKQKLAWDAARSRHVWHQGDQPAAVVGDLDGSPAGHNLAELVNITLNDKAYMLGYGWQASGQNLPFCGASDPTSGQIYAFQNISVLEDPQASLKFPTCGFSQQPYLVYDQFGPLPLLSLDGSLQGGLDRGEVTAPLRAAFAANTYPLPGSATVKVEQATVHWLISTGLATASYDLRREPSGRISVFTYPTPRFSPDNFYVDPRSGVYHLRRVALDGETPFDIRQPGPSYGYFTQPHLDSVVVHPAGYVVGVNFANSKMEILQIPEQGAPDGKAQPASLVSGVGVRQGLMEGPRAIAVAADGRLLVLEELNRRIQAFDLNGNPVACFDGGAITTVSADAAAPGLDRGLAEMPLREAMAQAGAPLSAHWTITDGRNQYDIRLDPQGTLNLQQNGADLSSRWQIADAQGEYLVTAETAALVVHAKTPFNLPLADRQLLDRGGVGEEIVAAFAANGITLALQAQVTGNGLQVPAAYQLDLARGVIPAGIAAAFATRGVEITGAAALTARVVVRVQTPGKQWVLADTDATRSYRVVADAAGTAAPAGSQRLAVSHLTPTMELHVADPGEKVTYLDLAVEPQGFLYVLSYAGQGKSVEDYRLDLYEPSGRFLSRTPDRSKDPRATGVNAARLIVDAFRSVYTLNFERFLGPGNRTEPSVSTWLPTTPKG